MEKIEKKKILGCPFCGSIPEVGLAKKTYCSLHGDPSQEVFVRCKKHECPARPKVSHGDVYNGGFDNAKKEAIEKWNARNPNILQLIDQRIEELVMKTMYDGSMGVMVDPDLSVYNALESLKQALGERK